MNSSLTTLVSKYFQRVDTNGLKFSAKTRNRALIALVLICLAHIIMRIQEGHPWGGDFSLYIAQSEAILNGTTDSLYAANKFTTEHSSRVLGPTLYPVGFPLLISPVVAVFGLNFIVLKSYCSLYFLASIPVLFFLFLEVSKSLKLSLLAVSFFTLSKGVLKYSDHVLSDYPFLFFSVLTISLMLRPSSIARNIALGLLIFVCVSIRHVGVVLLPTLFLSDLLTLKHSKALGFKQFVRIGIPFAIFLVLFWIMEITYGFTGQNQLELLSKLSIEKVQGNLIKYSEHLSLFFFGKPVKIYDWLKPLGALLIVGLSLKGAFRLHDKSPSIAIYTLLFVLALVIWPSRNGVRLLLPALPFIVFLTLTGIKSFEIPFLRKSLDFLLIVAFINFMFESVRSSYSALRSDSNTSFSEEMRLHYDFIETNTPANARIGFFKPRVLRLYTGRNSYYESTNGYKPNLVDYALLKNEESVRTNDEVLLKTQKFTLYKLKKETE
jgi:hypothetical protein